MAKKRRSKSAKKPVAARKRTSNAKRTTAKKSVVGRQAKRTAPRTRLGGSAKAPSAKVRPKVKLTGAIENPPGFPIVGIGASAGGLEALESFFKAMPADAGIGFVLVVHLDPTHSSILPELLQKHTTMPVRQIEDGMKVEPDHVYVIPPNKDLTVLRGKLHLMDFVQPRATNLPIDSFFRSLAQDQEHNAICIVLSGTGTDGTLGAKAIKGGVGMVMVQDEQSAKYEGMPRSVVATGLGDYVLPPGKMPEQLIKYTRHATQKTLPGISPAGEPIPEALQKVFVILRARTEHDFSLYKKNTICRRIERRMNVNQIDDISEYVRYLQKSDREAGILFKELLIGVTSFFRDPEAFQILQTKTLPGLLAEKPDDYAFRVWVPGCASGEEAYSVAIVLHECMGQTGRRFHVQIFGTDIDEDAIQVARAGLYPESIVADVGSERIQRYFTAEEDGRYGVKKLIREMLVFAPQDVIKDPPFTKLDLLCCRNLLIYLGTELQRRLLPIFHYSLMPDGILFLGSSETIGPHEDLFAASNKKWRIFRRRPSTASRHAVLVFPRQPESYEARDLGVPETVQRAEELSALQLVETILEQSDTPPCAIINDACNTVYIHGRTGRFLEPAEGKASVNLVEMARPGLKKALALAIRQVATSKQATVRKGLEVNCNGDRLLVDLTVKPILEQTAMRGLMMVMFEETAAPKKRTKPDTKPAPATRRSRSVGELEQELQRTRESLQSTIEELETSNEELKSTNEELQSTNEELQSTNEESETSKEELQSLNEESTTVNAELQARIEELSTTNDDMKNLLDSTDIATVFLDSDLRVRRFTPRATDIIPLTATDAGRPIKHLASSLLDTHLEAYGRQVLEDLVVREAEVESEDDRSYVMRVRPYRTVANVIDGVVITFEDITARKQTEEALREKEATLRKAQEMAHMGSWSLDVQTNRVTWSDELFRIFGMVPQETPFDYDQLVERVHHDDRSYHEEIMNQLATEGKAEFEYRLTRPDGETRWVSGQGETLYDKHGDPAKMIGTVQDTTERRQDEHALHASEQRYRMLFEMASDAIVLIDAATKTMVEYNRRACEPLGYSREEFGRLTLLDIEAAESANAIERKLDRVVSQGSNVFETKHKTKDGEIRDVRAKARAISIGEKTFLLITWHDITPVPAGA